MSDENRRNIYLKSHEIQMPKPQVLERLLGDHFRRKGEKFIRSAIKGYAIFPDGAIDNELADSIRKELTRRIEVSLRRDVLEPTGWAGISGVVMGGSALVISKEIEGKAITPTSLKAAGAGMALGACMDLYRVNRRFNSGLEGALSGALRAVKEARSPYWEKEEAERRKIRDAIQR